MLVTHAQRIWKPLAWLGIVLPRPLWAGHRIFPEFTIISLMLGTHMNLDIQYVAGLFDGEGWITVNVWSVPGREYIRYQLFVGIGMNHYPLMRKMKEQFGGLLHRNDSAHKRNAEKNRINYQWRLSSRPAAQFLASIRPHLNIKGDEADLAIELQAHITKHASDFKYRKHLRPELYAYRQQMVDKIRTLKKRSWDVPNGSDPVLVVVQTASAKVAFSA